MRKGLKQQLTLLLIAVFNAVNVGGTIIRQTKGELNRCLGVGFRVSSQPILFSKADLRSVCAMQLSLAAGQQGGQQVEFHNPRSVVQRLLVVPRGNDSRGGSAASHSKRK